MIRIILAALFVFAGFGSLAQAQTREIYTIRDISVDERADTVIEAQQKAFASARIKGAYRLIERLTLPEDRVGKIPPGSGQGDLELFHQSAGVGVSVFRELLVKKIDPFKKAHRIC